jgi:hypothetical protein
MASFNLTNFDAAMKHMYPFKKVENMVYKSNPLLAMIPKDTSFPGRNATYAVEYGLTTGRSADFQTAQNNRGGTRIEDFVVTRVKDYAVVSVDNETLLAADGSEGSLLDVAKSKTDSALHALSRTMGRDIYRSGTGSIMKLAASGAVSGSVVTPLAGGTIQVEVGMRLKGSATDGSALYDGVLTVESVDRKANTFATTVAPGTAMASLGDNDFLYVEGDAKNNISNIKMAGLDSWLPESIASSGDSHFGVNRYIDSSRLGGQRQDFADSSIQDTLIQAAVLVAREGGRPDAVFINPSDWAELAVDLEGRALANQAYNRRRFENGDDMAQFGFATLQLATPAGMVDIVADHNCPENICYMLQLNTWKFKSLGQAPRLLDFDGLKGIRQSNEDGVEYRWGYYGNLLCTAPGFNCRIALSS